MPNAPLRKEGGRQKVNLLCLTGAFASTARSIQLFSGSYDDSSIAGVPLKFRT